MPTWLVWTYGAAFAAAAIYLLYVIVHPEDF